MVLVFVVKQKTAYDLRISDWSSDVCSSDLVALLLDGVLPLIRRRTADLRQTIGVLRALRDRAAEAREELATAGTRLDDSRRLLARAEKQHREQARGLATESMLESDRALALSVEAKEIGRAHV